MKNNSCSCYLLIYSLLLHILLIACHTSTFRLKNPVSCGADGFLGDAHDAMHVAVFHAHFGEDEEEGVVGGLGSVFLLDTAERGEVDGLIVVDEAFVVIVRPAGGSSVPPFLFCFPQKFLLSTHYIK